jgi:Domain of unknown function (DUF4350)
VRKKGILWGAVLAAAAIAATLLLRPSGAAGASALSASPKGWLAARTYLERRGRRVSLLNRPLDQAPKVTEGRSLVLAFPWQGFPSKEELDALHRRLAAGGSIVFAYSGQSRSIAEDFVASALGFDLGKVRGAPPLSPLRWYAFVREQWRLKPEGTFAPGSAPDVVIQAPDRVPNAPKGAEVLYRGGREVPAVFSFSRSRGRVIVVPADGLSNARVGNSGNADLLESLRVALGEEIAFDEYHHGLVAPDVVARSGSAPNLDLVLAQILLLYFVLTWALGRRFGPAWEEPPEIASSTEAFLLGLGALHRKLRHSAPACVRLLDDAGRLDPRVQAPPEVRTVAFDAGERAFLDVAKVIARLQRRGRFD